MRTKSLSYQMLQLMYNGSSLLYYFYIRKIILAREKSNIILKPEILLEVVILFYFRLLHIVSYKKYVSISVSEFQSNLRKYGQIL